jgi:hypothetical protein
MPSLSIQNIEAGQAANDTLLSGIQKLGVVCDTAGTAPFNVLTQADPDLGTNFIAELNNSLSDLFDFLYSHIYPAAVTYFDKEPDPPDPPSSEEKSDDEKPTGETPTGGDNLPPGGGGTPRGNTPPPDKEPETTTEIETPELTDETIKKLDASLTSLSLTELDGAIDSLIALAEQKNKYLDELVEDDQFADDIKQMLLDSPYIPQEFKDMIKDMDSKLVRQYIESLLKGESPDVFELNPLNIGIIYSYLMRMAAQNGITVEELLADPKYTSLLKTILSRFSNVVDLLKGWENLTPEEFQKNLLTIYDGDEVGDLPQEDIDVIRAFVDYIAEETEIGYEELLTDTTYAETLKDAAMQFGKACVFFNATSHFTDDGMRKNSAQMFDGTNHKAYGMDDNEVKGFREEMDALAKEKGTTTDKLFSDGQYADDVKAALANSKNAEGVGSIFKDAQSSVSQNVAKNLYNTTLKSEIEITASDVVTTSDGS